MYQNKHHTAADFENFREVVPLLVVLQKSIRQTRAIKKLKKKIKYFKIFQLFLILDREGVDSQSNRTAPNVVL